jgi:hypothetical protein
MVLSLLNPPQPQQLLPPPPAGEDLLDGDVTFPKPTESAAATAVAGPPAGDVLDGDVTFPKSAESPPTRDDSIGIVNTCCIFAAAVVADSPSIVATSSFSADGGDGDCLSSLSDSDSPLLLLPDDIMSSLKKLLGLPGWWVGKGCSLSATVLSGRLTLTVCLVLAITKNALYLVMSLSASQDL